MVSCPKPAIPKDRSLQFRDRGYKSKVPEFLFLASGTGFFLRNSRSMPALVLRDCGLVMADDLETLQLDTVFMFADSGLFFCNSDLLFHGVNAVEVW